MKVLDLNQLCAANPLYAKGENMSIQADDVAAQAVQKINTERVSLDVIRANIKSVAYMTGDRFLARADRVDYTTKDTDILYASALTICLMTLNNGWMVIGKSAPADANNFNADLGRKFAYEDAIRQVWPLLGFLLRERLSQG